MMGLAVIVILLALGIFFVTKFTVLNQEPSLAQSSQRKSIAIGFVNTLLSSDANCGTSATFSDLIEAMADPENTLFRCKGEDLNTHFDESIKSILDNTLEKWNKDYEFTVIFPPQVSKDVKDILIRSDLCKTTRKRDAGSIFPIKTDFGADIRVQMKICY